jgi:hypothetical protein
MKKFTLILFLSVIFTGFAFAQESLLGIKGKNQIKENANLVIDRSTNKIIPEIWDKAEKSTSFYEGFETSPNPLQGLLPQGWTEKRTSTLNAPPIADPDPDPEIASWFRQERGVYGFDFNFVYAGKGSLAISYEAPEFTWAISPEFTLDGSPNDLAFLTYWVWYQHSADDNWFTNYHVKVFSDGAWTTLKSFDGIQDPTDNLFESEVALDVSAYIGKTIQLAFVYEYTDGFELAIDEVEVYVLPSYDNGIISVFYEFYQWWPASVDKEMRFDIEVGGEGLAPGKGEVSLFVNDQLQETLELENMLYGMFDTVPFLWTPTAPGIYNLRFQLSDLLDDGDGNMVADENAANNIVEFTFDIPDPESILFSEGFEHVDWDDPEGASAIFPPNNEWLFTDNWGVTTSRAMRDLISAAVYQIKGDQPEVLITPGMNLPAGDVKIDLIVGGLNNGITEDEVYLGHSTLEVHLLDAVPNKDINEGTLLFTYALDSLVGNSARKITLFTNIETEGTYYLQFVTTSTFDFVDSEGEVYASGVFLDNIMVSSTEMVDVTFNVDVTNLDGFDPATHNIYMTGTPTNWALPGSEYSVTMTRENSVTESIIYTTTISLEDGSDVAYRYYSDLIGEGFLGGEWDVNVSREVNIDGTMVINDIWASYLDVSVDEVSEVQNIMVYPNPVRENLTIANGKNISSVRIFDITGRVVFSAEINDLSTRIDVSDFHQGVYVVQIISGNEVISRKINVVK